MKAALKYLILSEGGQAAPGAPVNTVLPSISGDNDYIGTELTCSTGTWTGDDITYSYQWKRDGVNITDETNSTYTIVSADAEPDVELTCEVTATNSAGSDSATTAVFLAVYNPTTLFLDTWPAYAAYQDTSESIPAVDGKGIRSVRNETRTADIEFIGSSTGKAQPLTDELFGNFVTDVATVATSNITLSGEQTINGVLTSASRVAVVGQTNQTQNGIYVSGAGAWTRATDADSDAELRGLVVNVAGGDLAGNQYAILITTPITVGSSNIVFTDLTSDPETIYPKFHQEDGGFVHITNSISQRLETSSTLGTISGDFCGAYIIRLTGGTYNESAFGGSNGFVFNDDEPNGVVSIGQFNSLVDFSGGGRVQNHEDYNYVLLLIELERQSDGSLRLWVNGTAWNGGEAVAAGTNNMTEHYWGVNAHAADCNFYISGIYTGTRDTTKINRFLKYVTKRHGAIGSYPQDYPMVTFNASAGEIDDTLIWNNTLNRFELPAYTFRSPIGAAEGATEVVWFGTQSNSISVSIGQRTFIKRRLLGVDSDFGYLERGVDFGIGAAETATNVRYQAMLIGVDEFGNRQVVGTFTQTRNDNTT